ncbi:hypothetical protein R3W88_012106 [Solanum pinnatisectum]|uniref:Uncharacterized protein n=1 Tax=Solanum pinnatisectum TaxID=50273 RepID=A0AAV9L9D4_9SOLN|nr:hypothetical protein R3W88_012106 [Solanum pinnatisectum]
MLSAICHVRSLLQEEMRLDSTFTDTPEISDDKTITSVLESACNDNDTEIVDTMKSQLDYQLPILDVGYKIQKHISPSVLSSASIATTELKFSRLSFSVKESTFPVKGYRHKLGMEFYCKVDYSVNRVLLFGYSKCFPLLSVDDASDVCDVSSVTTTHKVFADMSDRLYPESGSDIMIMDRIALLHKIKCLQLPFDPGVYVTHDVVIFFCDMCEDIRIVTHIEYLCVYANRAIEVVSPSALEKYIDAYDFRQYLNFRNFNLSWQLYTIVAFSYGDNNFTMLGLLEKLNTTGEVPVYLWYNSNVEINLTTDVLLSGNWLGLIVFSADQVLHILVNNQCARTVFACLGNSKRSGSNDINQRAVVNMNSGISFIHGVLNVGPQSEKWNGSVFGLVSPTGVDDCSVIVLWIILEICIQLFCGLMPLEYPITTSL